MLASRQKMPEILEERFERAKSGLMLAPAKTQALLFSETAIIARLEMQPGSGPVAGGDFGPQEKTVARPRQIDAGQDDGRAQGLEF
jgi:hypothetical protein